MNKYYYIDSNGTHQGPIDADKLISNGVTAETSIWTEGMTDWMPARKVPELNEYFPSSTPPPFTSQTQSASNASPENMPAKPDNNLVWAILCLVMCCQPFGIIALVKACEVDSLYNKGDYQAAVKSAEEAKKWSMWGAISSIVFVVLYLMLYFFCGLAAFLADKF